MAKAGSKIRASDNPSTIGGIIPRTGASPLIIGIGGNEVDLWPLPIQARKINNGRVYAFTGNISLNATLAGESWSVWVRKGAPLTGEVVGSRIWISNGAGMDDNISLNMHWPCTADETTDFYLSLRRNAGSGSAALYGQGASHWRIADVGAFTGPDAVWAIT